MIFKPSRPYKLESALMPSPSFPDGDVGLQLEEGAHVPRRDPDPAPQRLQMRNNFFRIFYRIFFLYKNKYDRN